MNGNVLIIDDSPILRRSIRRSLVEIGLEERVIFEASNGIEGLAALASRNISLVLLDLNMPVMNGEEFLTKMRGTTAFSDIPVVIVTTEVNGARLMRLGKLGISGFLHKPFQTADLRAVTFDNLGQAS